MDAFQEKYSLLKLKQKAIKNMKSPVSINKIESVINQPFCNENSTQVVLLVISSNHLRMVKHQSYTISTRN